MALTRHTPVLRALHSTWIHSGAPTPPQWRVVKTMHQTVRPATLVARALLHMAWKIIVQPGEDKQTASMVSACAKLDGVPFQRTARAPEQEHVFTDLKLQSLCSSLGQTNVLLIRLMGSAQLQQTASPGGGPLIVLMVCAPAGLILAYVVQQMDDVSTSPLRCVSFLSLDTPSAGSGLAFTMF